MRIRQLNMVYISLLACTVMLAGCENMWEDHPDPQISAVNPREAYVDAHSKLLEAAGSTDPQTRSHAMEAIGKVLGTQGGPQLEQGLRDKFSVVQFAAAMSIGDCKYKPAEDELLAIVNDPEMDKRTTCAAIYGLYELGNTDYVHLLAKAIISDKESIRACGAMVLGKIGDPSAIGPLKNALREESNPALRMNIVQALAELGDKHSQKILASYTQGYFLDMKLAAIPALAECHVPQAEIILKNLLRSSKPPRVRMAATAALASLSTVDNEAYEDCIECLENPEMMIRDHYGEKFPIKEIDVSSLKRLAILALGEIGQRRSLDILMPRLSSTDSAVRVSAAMAILQILEPVRKKQLAESQASDTATEGESPKKPETPSGYVPKLFQAQGMDDFPAGN